jgi:acyl dehydratase
LLQRGENVMGISEELVGKTFGPFIKEYGWKDIVLYALGVGSGGDELEYVYERNLKPLPSFAVLSTYDLLPEVLAISGINLAGLVHGEQDLFLHHPLPPAGGILNTTGRITHLYDKGKDKGALLIAEVETSTAKGLNLFTNVVTLFARLDGGFGGEASPKEEFSFPERAPDFVERVIPSVNQPLLYRLSGDTFPLHVDLGFAQASGFERPIMHGLCTHGFACRAIIKHLFPGEPDRMSRFRTRFSKPLYPGIPINTQIWKLDDGRAVFNTVNEQTGEVVLDRGIVEWAEGE